METPWTSLPAASALLADCATLPPPTRTVRGNHGGYETRFCSTVGPNADRRVAELRRIHDKAVGEALAAHDRGELTSEAFAQIVRFDAQAAIRAAIAQTRKVAA